MPSLYFAQLHGVYFYSVKNNFANMASAVQYIW